MCEKVVVGVVEDMAEEKHCRDHPEQTNPSGICPYCLQEKLRKLISSSKSSNPLFYKPPPPSSFSPPSFPSFKTPIPASRKKSFWSFLTPSSLAKRRSIEYCSDKEDDEDSASYDRKLSSRSRSIGCGSRSFSADFLQRISNGLRDCALKRTETHRGAKATLSCDKDGEQRRIKARVKCGGMFGGLGVIPSSSYLLSAKDSGDFEELGILHAVKRGGRSESRGWVFASPVRAFKAAGGGLLAIVTGGGRSGDANRSIVAIRGL